jgi:hypothetical protein
VAKRELDRLSGVTYWRLHDLRRTCVSGRARRGIAPHVADKVLNDQAGTISGVAAVYQRHDFIAERREALEMWGTHVRQTIGDPSEKKALRIVARLSSTGAALPSRASSPVNATAPLGRSHLAARLRSGGRPYRPARLESVTASDQGEPAAACCGPPLVEQGPRSERARTYHASRARALFLPGVEDKQDLIRKGFRGVSRARPLAERQEISHDRTRPTNGPSGKID